MSHQLAGFAGFLAVVAVATPHLGSMISPAAHADVATAPVRVIDTPAPVIAAAPPAPAPMPLPAVAAPAYSVSVNSDLVSYGDSKTSDFDPENPPADMGEAG